jgi:hypothetical protein
MHTSQSARVLQLLESHPTVPGAQEALARGARSVPWWSSPGGVRTAEMQDTYERRGRLAAGAAGPNVGRAGNWEELLPVLRSVRLERIAFHAADLPSGHHALAFTDEALGMLFGVLVVVPRAGPPPREPWMGSAEE